MGSFTMGLQMASLTELCLASYLWLRWPDPSGIHCDIWVKTSLSYISNIRKYKLSLHFRKITERSPLQPYPNHLISYYTTKPTTLQFTFVHGFTPHSVFIYGHVEICAKRGINVSVSHWLGKKKKKMLFMLLSDSNGCRRERASKRQWWGR